MKKVIGTIVLVLGFQVAGRFSLVAQEQSARPLSPRVTALQSQLQQGNSAPLDRFWDEIAAHGAPLIESIPGDPGHGLVTFLWRGKEGTKNVLVSSWFGYRQGRFDIADNLMAHLPGTDVWYKTYRVRSDARTSYRLSPNDSLVPFEEVKEEDWAKRIATFQPDPFNPHRQFYPHDDQWESESDFTRSIVELPAAPPQPWIRPQPGVAKGQLEVHRFTSKILGNQRRVWVYTPAGYTSGARPYHLLVLFDGWDYSQWIPTPTILDNLVAEGRLPPVVAVMVGEPTIRDRILDLSCHAPFNDFLAHELIPWVHQHYHVTNDPAQTVVGGLSRGGLAAAFAGFQHPEIFGNVLSQSGYFSWPAEDADTEEENEKNDANYGWLIRQYVASPKLPLRFYLDSGLFEEVNENRHMRDVLQARGYPVHYLEFSGGHDYLAWQGTLADGLLLLIGKHTDHAQQPKE